MNWVPKGTKIIPIYKSQYEYLKVNDTPQNRNAFLLLQYNDLCCTFLTAERDWKFDRSVVWFLHQHTKNLSTGAPDTYKTVDLLYIKLPKPITITHAREECYAFMVNGKDVQFDAETRAQLERERRESLKDYVTLPDPILMKNTFVMKFVRWIRSIKP